jgi:acyl-CoA hydrolase
MTAHYNDCKIAAENIIARVGKRLVIGLPLGLGKPIGLINALYALAVSDPSIDLTIVTALTLTHPDYHNELEERLVAPLLLRVLGDYEDPSYEKPRVAQKLPPNIRVIEFFLMTAKYLHNNYVQQNYISSTYSLAARDALHQGMNVMAQQVARSKQDGKLYSVSCNSDLFYTVVNGLRKAESAGRKIAVVAEVNDNLPFMLGQEAIVPDEVFTEVVDTGQYRHLFAVPHDELSAQDHLIGLYTSYLIKDGGCLQIGIGKLSNAVAYGLITRHTANAVYQSIYQKLSVAEKFGDTVRETGALTPFDEGLYASTEMLSDGYMQLYKADILKRKSYDHSGLQRLLNERKITETIQPDILNILLEHKIISANLTDEDCAFLRKFGIFKADVSLVQQQLHVANEKIPADLNDMSARQKMIASCLGQTLQSGILIHAGFFLGSNDFYQQLRDLTPDQLQQIDMTSIARTNSLNWNYELLSLQRRDGRFINTAMMVTLGSVVISDGLKDMQEVSGVGGQFDFINMAHNLPDGRSIINLRSTRESHVGATSNIIWEYPNYTVPRFMRDIIVTEYGIADCRSKTDVEIIKAMLNIADSRFQPGLMRTAKSAGLLPADYEIPALFQQNYPEKVEAFVKELQQQGLCEPYPFGTEMTGDEQVIVKALMGMKNLSKLKTLITVIKAVISVASSEKNTASLERMQLDKPKNFKDFIYKKLLNYTLNQQAKN